jgi:peptidoglycan hydrolase-like protein with peptidoglycan-binding domain
MKLPHKQEQFNEGTIRAGYMRDMCGVTDAQMTAAGVTDLKAFPTTNPPQELLDKVLNRLGLEDEFKGMQPKDVVASPRFQSAVMEDKLHGDRLLRDKDGNPIEKEGRPVHVKGWIDDRVNNGALEEMDKSIAAQKQLRELSNGFDALAIGDRGTGVAVLQTAIGVEPTGIFDETTKKAVIAWQENLSEEQLKQGRGALDADGVIGLQTIKAALAQKPPTDFAAAKHAFITENPDRASTLEVADAHRLELAQMRANNISGGNEKKESNANFTGIQGQGARRTR